MEEEWMRDRALLRDLLQKTPQASPRELAQATGRSISWVKKWRKRLTKGDPHDHSVLFSRSRVHHAPLCWLLGTSVQEIGILHTIEHASLPKHVNCEYN